MKLSLRLAGLFAVGVFLATGATAQVAMSSGTYSQNFDSLANSGTVNWTNNLTLPGWYSAKGGADAATYIASAGTGNSGSIYSFGTNGVNPASDRALGSIASSSTAYAYGVRFTNDTGSAQSNITVSYTGEQWRNANGTGAVTNTLSFSYQIAGAPLTNADAADAQTWTPFSALDFNSPIVNAGGSGTALDGNAAANRQNFTNIVLTGAVVQPGQELFLRWRDVNDTASDAGIAVDDLTVRFQAVAGSQTPPVITLQPQNQAAAEGGFAIFSANATGSPAPNFQWQFNGTNLAGATRATLALTNLTANQAGFYSVTTSNSAGATNSATAALLVTPVSIAATNGAIRMLQYNVAGNGVADWSTNTAQAQAIGRELVYFNADIITFNEIPTTNGVAQMTNWVSAFMPGYYLATNSFGDTFIQSVIASRFPITRSASHLHTANLNPFGYTNSSSQNADNFSRDLFEAQIAVPNWPLPLHVFVAHLKATTSDPPSAAAKRAAEASAVSNYFATVYLAGTNAAHPYVLAGDMNEDAFFPETSRYTSGRPIQRLTSPPTGLQMTIPINPITRTDLTESIRGALDTRFDYILPCAMLFSNIAASEVFRTDLLTNFPPNLYSNDDKIASDHLPVLMVFNNPFDTPFKLLSVARANQSVTLNWESQNNRHYNVETSSNVVSWTPFATNLITTTTNPVFSFATNYPGNPAFFRIYRAP